MNQTKKPNDPTNHCYKTITRILRARIITSLRSINHQSLIISVEDMAAEEGFEPSQTESESAVLPLHHSASQLPKNILSIIFREVNTKLKIFL